MRLLWVSDSPDTPSGFGNVTRFVCEGLTRRGYEVSILGWQTLELGEWRGCKLYPIHRDRLGGDALYPLLLRIRPDIVIALADVWWLPYFSAPHFRRQMELTDTPWLLYFPIDGDIGGDRLPPSWVEMLAEVDIPVAMSRYGQRVAKNCGIRCEYIPHGVDLGVFRPPSDREAAKARVGYSGKFVVLSDSRNQPRKMLPRLLDVFNKFATNRPNVVLHLHTDPEDEFTRSLTYSYNVREDLRYLGLESKVHFSGGFTLKRGGGLPLPDLATYYQAADVHLLASSGEGFGLPTLQAAAAGAVPMACAYSASQELTEGPGEPLAIAEWTENEFGIRRALIDVDSTVERLARYYDDPSLLRGRSASARLFAEAYGWESVIEQWDRLLSSVGGFGRRVRRSNRNPSQSIDDVASHVLPKLPGMSVSVKIVSHPFGRLESSILADARGHVSDVRIPTVPKPCEVTRVSVPRRPGYVGLSLPDSVTFERLRRIFPILHGWAPRRGAGTGSETGISFLSLECPEEARYDLAQSVLLLNVAGELPDSMLVDAALYGVPSIGAPTGKAQALLWPELVTSDREAALVMARRLLTNAAYFRRVSAEARSACDRIYAPSEEASAAWLRRLHSAHVAGAAPVAR